MATVRERKGIISEKHPRTPRIGTTSSRPKSNTAMAIPASETIFNSKPTNDSVDPTGSSTPVGSQSGNVPSQADRNAPAVLMAPTISPNPETIALGTVPSIPTVHSNFRNRQAPRSLIPRPRVRIGSTLDEPLRKRRKLEQTQQPRRQSFKYRNPFRSHKLRTPLIGSRQPTSAPTLATFTGVSETRKSSSQPASAKVNREKVSPSHLSLLCCLGFDYSTNGSKVCRDPTQEFVWPVSNC